MREKDIEAKCRFIAIAAGGILWKWTSPGRAGVPDRILILPGGRVAFVEFKAPGKKPTVQQLACHRVLTDLGVRVAVIDDPAAFARLIEEVMK